MNVLDLFSGIGGFSLGLERAGMKTVAFCEIEEYPRKVLAKHWPDVPIYTDVREVTHAGLKSDGIPRIDVITGGFPCQDISVAGKQAGINEGTRSGLWSECARLLGEIRPRYAIFENVTALLSGDNGRWFQRVLFDISQVGYDAEWHCIPASELGAHHHRDRVWIICYPQELYSNGSDHNREDSKRKISESGNTGCEDDVADTTSGRCQEPKKPTPRIFKGGDAWWRSGDRRSGKYWFLSLSGVRRVTYGVSNQSHRIKALGNAVVPQIPELIGRAIMADQWG